MFKSNVPKKQLHCRERFAICLKSRLQAANPSASYLSALLPSNGVASSSKLSCPGRTRIKNSQARQGGDSLIIAVDLLPNLFWPNAPKLRRGFPN